MITVYVWKSRRCHLLPTGHASLVICPEDREEADIVCTWFPNELGGKKASSNCSWRKGSSFGSSQAATADYPATPVDEWGPFFMNHNNYDMAGKVIRFAKEHPEDPIAQETADRNIRNDVFPPSEAVYIRSIRDTGSYVGLSDDMICQWWEKFTARENRYHLVKQNCSTITASALIAGGGSAFADKPTGSSLYWTPDSVLSFAKNIKRTIDEIQDMYTTGYHILDRLANEAPDSFKVWTRKEWYQASEENVSFLSRRYPKLKQIDKCLDFYHNHILANPYISADFKSECIIKELSEIEGILATIVALRPNTKRSAAIGMLAKQCRYKREAERNAIHSRLKARRRKKKLYKQFLQQQLELQAQMDDLQTDHSLSDNKRRNRMQLVSLQLIQIQQELSKIGPMLAI